MNHHCDSISNIINYEIICYKHKYKRDLGFYIFFEIMIMVLLALIPIIVIYKLTSTTELLLVIITALLVILNALMVILNLRCHYVAYKHTYKRLELEKYTYKFRESPYSDDSDDKHRNAQILQHRIKVIILYGEKMTDVMGDGNCECNITSKKTKKDTNNSCRNK